MLPNTPWYTTHISCDAFGKNYMNTYLEKHKKDVHYNTREKIRCICGSEIYGLKQHFNKLIRYKNHYKIPHDTVPSDYNLSKFIL